MILNQIRGDNISQSKRLGKQNEEHSIKQSFLAASALDQLDCIDFSGKKEKIRLENLGQYFSLEAEMPVKRLDKEGVLPKELPTSQKWGEPYRNLFDIRPKASLNADFRETLKLDKASNKPDCLKVHHVQNAYTRISSFSSYLKEKMVGFVTPDGENWFEKALKNLLNGSVATEVDPKHYKPLAKELFGTLSMADDYWKSTEFIRYLATMEQNPAVLNTLQAVCELKSDDEAIQKVAFGGGYSSKLKNIKELAVCAYTNRALDKGDVSQAFQVSVEHLLPHSKGGTDEDTNFVIAASRPNMKRGNMPLLPYLKGWDCKEWSAELNQQFLAHMLNKR